MRPRGLAVLPDGRIVVSDVDSLIFFTEAGEELESRKSFVGLEPFHYNSGLSMSHDDLVKLLTTGETPDGDTIGGEMAKVTANTGKLSAEDRAAIATYVKSLPPVEGPRPPKPK